MLKINEVMIPFYVDWARSAAAFCKKKDPWEKIKDGDASLLLVTPQFVKENGAHSQFDGIETWGEFEIFLEFFVAKWDKEDEPDKPTKQTTTAVEILSDAADCIGDRAASRDTPEGERSMARCVKAFNALTGHELTESAGWLFMELLKAARSTAGGYNPDDFVDGTAYVALRGECEAREN